MRKLLIGIALSLPFALVTPVIAAPAANHAAAFRDAMTNSDLLEVKGGRGGGHGHGWGRGGGHRAWGWSRGRKVGWRGRGCPPGLWKQGRC